jgi:hypothetical protein
VFTRHHPQVISLFMGGISTIPSHGWHPPTNLEATPWVVVLPHVWSCSDQASSRAQHGMHGEAGDGETEINSDKLVILCIEMYRINPRVGWEKNPV